MTLARSFRTDSSSCSVALAIFSLRKASSTARCSLMRCFSSAISAFNDANCQIAENTSTRGHQQYTIGRIMMVSYREPYATGAAPSPATLTDSLSLDSAS